MKFVNEGMLGMKSAALSTLMISVLPVFIAGCAPATPAPTATPSPTPAPVILQYIGVSCTLITAPDGTRIVSDPYAASPRPTGLGPLPSDLEADVVTVSHSHFDHSNVEGVGGEPQIIQDPGSYQAGMVEITGYESGEGSPSGPTGHNTVFVFEIGEVKIVHMGDGGVITSPDLLAAIENADVIIVNVDGYVLPFDQFMVQMQQINARTIIPSHYSISEDARFNIWATVDEFLETLPSDVVVVREGSEIQVTPGMPEQVAVLTSLTLVE